MTMDELIPMLNETEQKFFSQLDKELQKIWEFYGSKYLYFDQQFCVLYKKQYDTKYCTLPQHLFYYFFIGREAYASEKLKELKKAYRLLKQERRKGRLAVSEINTNTPRDSMCIVYI